jgi:hypothetical protein
VTGTAVDVAHVKSGTWSLRTWACQGCSSVAFLGEQAVSVSGPVAASPFGAPPPSLLVFPQSGTGQPTTLPVTGIKHLPIDTEFWVVGSTSPDSVVVDYGDLGGSNAGGIQLLYQVSPDGKATQYGHGTVSQSRPTPGTILGRITTFAASQTGSEAVFTAGQNGGACGGIQVAHLLDTRADTVSTPSMPAGGGPAGYWVEGMWFDRTGTPYASLLPNTSDCSTTGTPVSGGMPSNSPFTVVKLQGGSWVTTGTGVYQAAYGPGGWVAEMTGTWTPAGPPKSLTISGGPGTTPVTIPDVSSFAWAP